MLYLFSSISIQANVACVTMGFARALGFKTCSYFGELEERRKYGYENLQCLGSEANIAACSGIVNKATCAGEHSAAGVICEDKSTGQSFINIAAKATQLIP